MTIYFTEKEQVIADDYMRALDAKASDITVNLEPTYAAYLKMLNLKLRDVGGLYQGIIFLNKYLHYNPEVLPDNFNEFNGNLSSYVHFLVNDQFPSLNYISKDINDVLDSDVFVQHSNVVRNFTVNTAMFTGLGNGGGSDKVIAQTVYDCAPLDISGRQIFSVAPSAREAQPEESL